MKKSDLMTIEYECVLNDAWLDVVIFDDYSYHHHDYVVVMYCYPCRSKAIYFIVPSSSLFFGTFVVCQGIPQKLLFVTCY